MYTRYLTHKVGCFPDTLGTEKRCFSAECGEQVSRRWHGEQLRPVSFKSESLQIGKANFNFRISWENFWESKW